MSVLPPTPKPAPASLVQERLDFQRSGYFTRPIEPADLAGLSADEADAWLALERHLTELKAGCFSSAHQLLALYRGTESWPLRRAAARVLGHTASAACFGDMRAELDAMRLHQRAAIDVPTREILLDYCHAFAAWGRLDVVPVLLELYLTLRFKRTAEIEMLPILMSRLLHDEHTHLITQPPYDEAELGDYFELVLGEYERAVARLGSDQVLVFRGQPRSSAALAEAMRHVTSKYVASELWQLRQRFEPATGVDCSAIFAGPSVSMAAATALAEAFLDSPTAADHAPGSRFFFGHPVPA